MFVRLAPKLRMLLLVCLVIASQVGWKTQAYSQRPNVLFIILDDVGKDQLTAFNGAAGTAAVTPTLDTVVGAGVKFTGLYTMPECSPTRSAFFTGRYPLRTGVTAAILNEDLPASHVSPYEFTTPRVLATFGYRSAMIGKYHLGGPENNPDGIRAPVALGWDYFNGNLRGGPPSIDVTLGGQYTRDRQKYSCGFPTGTLRGAGWFLGADGRSRCDDAGGAGFTGQETVARGGIPALDSSGELARNCAGAAGPGPDFSRPNGYYVWPMAVEDAASARTAMSREYMTTAQTDAAIAWIRARSQDSDRRPWMATVSYNAIHTPYQHPPPGLYPPGFVWPAGVPQDCGDSGAQRVLSTLMLGALDREIGRLLVGAGLAQQDTQGRLVYRPEATDTMVIIVGDNGTFIPSVLPPYDPIRSKGTIYETGITAPLIVAGPLVNAPGRTVGHQVNAVDLYQLFGEIADLDDVRELLPASRTVDAERVLPYLTNPNQPGARRTNFSQLGVGLKPATVKLWPCVVAAGPVNIATDVLFTSQSICEDTGGRWFGPTASQPNPPYPTSCAVRAAGLYQNLIILPNRAWALRNDQYKLVKLERPSCESNLGEYELYDLAARSTSNPAGLDTSRSDLLTNGRPVGLTAAQAAAFADLSSRMRTLLESEPECQGDGNLDKRVDLDDVQGVVRYWGRPSVFDFTQDGVTDVNDMQVVLQSYGRVCH